jgi:hypothetical protein
MKVIIAGSRDFTDYNLLKTKIDHMRFDGQFKIDEIVSGAACGADQMGENYAANNNIPVKEFPADWNTHGKAAGPIRNKQMAEYADALIAVWDGKSKGTKNMIETMNKLKKPVYVIWVGGDAVAYGDICLTAYLKAIKEL